MNYYEIGQRIRKYRKVHNLSQEELAEKVGISTTHMSHIETGNTKLSLPVLVSLAEVLQVRADDLLFDISHTNRSVLIEEIANNLEHCNVQQLNIINDLITCTKNAMNKYL